MLTFGGSEVILILVIALVFLGPRKLGEMGEAVARISGGRRARSVALSAYADHLLATGTGLAIGLFIALVTEPAAREWPSLLVFVGCALFFAFCTAYRVPAVL